MSTDLQLEDQTGTSFIFKGHHAKIIEEVSAIRFGRCHSAALLPVIICSFGGSGT